MELAVLLSVLVSCAMSSRVRVGVLSQPSSYSDLPPHSHSYIQSSYIRDLEGAGAQVIPILDFWDNTTIVNMMDDLHGILLPGGRTSLKTKNSKGHIEYTDYA